MDSLIKAQPILLIIFSLAIIGLIVWAIIMQRKLVANLVKNKISFIDMYEVDINSDAKRFAIVFTNQSMNDAIITSLGLVYKTKSFDYREVFVKQFNIEGGQIVFAPRAAYKMTLPIDDVERPLFPNVEKNFSKVQVFATTNAGALFIGKAKRISKVLKADYNAILREKKRRAKVMKEDAALKEKSKKAEQTNKKKLDFIQSVNDKKTNGEKISFGDKFKCFIYKMTTKKD